MKASKKIKVCIVGFTDKGANGVAYFISKHASIKYNIQIVSQFSKDVIVLVDGDTIDGQEYLTESKSAPHKILVAQFKKNPDCSLPWLKKPIIPVELIDQLIDLANQQAPQDYVKKSQTVTKNLNHNKLSSALTGKQTETSNDFGDDKVPTETVNFYTPENYLQGVIMRCMKKATSEKPYIQAHLPFGDLVVDAEDRKVYLLFGNKKIRSYGKLRITQTVMLRVIPDINDVQNMVKPNQVKSLDDWLWNLSVAASFGRLPKGIDIDEPMYLKYWPNLTRVRSTDFDMQIAALWNQNSLSIREVIEKMNIGHSFVYVFFAAAYSLGLMVSGTGTLIELKNQNKLETEQSIMARLLSYLRKAS